MIVPSPFASRSVHTTDKEAIVIIRGISLYACEVSVGQMEMPGTKIECELAVELTVGSNTIF